MGMQVVIMAAGRGVRMGALTEHTPKPMLLLLGKPLLEWKLEMLPENIDEVIVIVGYLSEQIKKYFGRTWGGRKMTYIHQAILNGTGGALVLVRELVKDRFLVIMGDDLYTLEDLKGLMSEELAILALRVEDGSLFGVLETTEDGYLKGVREKPPEKKVALVSTNAFVLHQKYFDYPPVRYSPTEYGLPHTVAEMSKDYPVKVISATAWQPIGKPEHILPGEAFLKKYWHVS